MEAKETDNPVLKLEQCDAICGRCQLSRVYKQSALLPLTRTNGSPKFRVSRFGGDKFNEKTKDRRETGVPERDSLDNGEEVEELGYGPSSSTYEIPLPSFPPVISGLGDGRHR